MRSENALSAPRRRAKQESSLDAAIAGASTRGAEPSRAATTAAPIQEIEPRSGKRVSSPSRGSAPPVNSTGAAVRPSPRTLAGGETPSAPDANVSASVNAITAIPRAGP